MNGEKTFKKERYPMTHKKDTTDLTEFLLKCMAQPDPMLSMLEWLCTRLMEAEVSGIVGAEKNAHNPSRRDYRCGYRPRRLDIRMGTMYLMVPKLRNQGYIPFFVTERKRSEAALIQVVQEVFVQGVSTRKMEKLARSLGIENLSRSQVSEMAKGLNEQVQYFRRRPLTGRYPVIWTDALYEKICMDGRVVNMTVMVVCGVNEQGHRDILARKISSTNMLERLNKEIRRRTSVVGIFPNPDSYLRPVTTCLMEYAEDWSVSRAYLNPKSILSLLSVA
jgi:putative transposase